MTQESNGVCVTIEPETRQPQSLALKTLHDVLSWKANNEEVFYSLYSGTKEFRRPTKPRTKPYTLVCHDFKGGYLEDRFLQGGAKKDAYYFCRWECIDIFVYFSHHFVTVPPLGWIRAAHKHGTMILGTIITEWEEGAALMSSLLSSRDTMLQVVSNLVAVCKCHQFDGWLVNVENKIEESQVSALKDFVQLLTEECHKHLPGSKVLWYDSVIRTGELKWQDQLNEENSIFFDASDGIFLNYCWTPEKLATSREMAVQKQRPFDVFVGIDVFGRGCPGGGGFNTREALEHAREYKLSAAIFAPGWVLESLDATDFDDNDCRFWAKLHDLCPLSDSSRLPVSSAFCQGHGDAFFCMGKDMTGRPWFNMSLQQRQPERTRVYGFEDPSELSTKPSLNTCLSSAYLGGCSIELSAHLTRPLQTVSFRLFSVRAKLDETLYCSYTYKENSDTSCDTFLVLTFGSGLLTRRAIMGSTDEPALEQFCDPDQEPKCKIAKVTGEDLFVKALTEEELEPLKSSLWFHDTQEIGGKYNPESWQTRHFRVDTRKLLRSSSTAEEESISIAMCLSQKLDNTCSPEQNTQQNNSGLHEDIQRASVLLGHIQVFREQDLKLQAPRVSGMKLTKLEPFTSGRSISSTNNNTGDDAVVHSVSNTVYVLRWDVEGDSSVDYFNIYLNTDSSPSLVGHTATTAFVMSVGTRFIQNGKVTVTIQPVLSATGLPQVLSKCATESLPLPAEC